MYYCSWDYWSTGQFSARGRAYSCQLSVVSSVIMAGLTMRLGPPGCGMVWDDLSRITGLSSYSLSPSSWLPLAHSNNSDRVPIEQAEAVKISWGQHQNWHTTFIRSYWSKQAARAKEIDSTSWWERHQSHIVKDMIQGEMDQFTSVAQSCPTFCNPMDCSTPGLPVHHQLPEVT